MTLTIPNGTYTAAIGPQATQAAPKRYHGAMTISEVARALNVSQSSIRRRCYAGIIPTVANVGAIRIPAAWVNRQLEQ